MAFTREDLDEWFKSFDTDGSGMIEVKELREVVKAFYEWQDTKADDEKIDADIKGMLATCDTIGDGKIDKKDFFNFFLSS